MRVDYGAGEPNQFPLVPGADRRGAGKDCIDLRDGHHPSPS